MTDLHILDTDSSGSDQLGAGILITELQDDLLEELRTGYPTMDGLKKRFKGVVEILTEGGGTEDFSAAKWETFAGDSVEVGPQYTDLLPLLRDDLSDTIRGCCHHVGDNMDEKVFLQKVAPVNASMIKFLNKLVAPP